MSAAIVAAVAISAVSMYSQNRAAKKARKQAKEDEIAARKREVFENTTGQGQGQVAELDLEVDTSENLGRITKRKTGLKI